MSVKTDNAHLNSRIIETVADQQLRDFTLENKGLKLQQLRDHKKEEQLKNQTSALFVRKK